ncbi:hypothetical protein BVJ53_14295 [Lacticaseibacillus chiayiensis]|uniref:Uncharacterized protein n=1 Tax=Lacticaseibacillus chiayiensis TaxID=2100821 RepID=A0A4Q1THD7_9LACO|nr:hypothetical protein BVJ53_14295 [Lacticaseibacillus chiayiensis]
MFSFELSSDHCLAKLSVVRRNKLTHQFRRWQFKRSKRSAGSYINLKFFHGENNTCGWQTTEKPVAPDGLTIGLFYLIAIKKL